MGGKDAQDALLDYLRASLKSKDGPDLARATEAERELPDKRAVDLLIKCLQTEMDRSLSPCIKSYTAEALGKIGYPRSSIYLAHQLNIDLDYVVSLDYWYLEAIRKTKGADAVPLLVQYLDRLFRRWLVRTSSNTGQMRVMNTTGRHNFQSINLRFLHVELSPAGNTCWLAAGGSHLVRLGQKNRSNGRHCGQARPLAKLICAGSGCAIGINLWWMRGKEGGNHLHVASTRS